MSYKFEWLEHGKIMLFAALEDFSVRVDGPSVRAECRKSLSDLPEPICVVNDFRHLELSHSEIMDNLSVLALDKLNDAPLWHHPNLRKVVVILSKNQLRLHIAAKGLAHEAYGSVSIDEAASVDEALDICHHVAGEAPSGE